jgi:hypothetical protein
MVRWCAGVLERWCAGCAKAHKGAVNVESKKI